MRVGVFQQPSAGMGGSEFVTAVMADALRADHDVDIVHHRPDLTVEHLERFFGLDLAGVRGRYVPRPAGHQLYAGRYLTDCRRYWRGWNAALSEPYDLFVANVNDTPPHCHARRGLLHVLFPTFARTAAWPWGVPSRTRASRLLDRVRRPLYEAGWRERMASYDWHVAISHYAAGWTERYWGVRPGVLYPPVPTDAAGGPKANAIVVLARFTPEKQQAELVTAFLDRVTPRAPGWELVLVGGLGDDPADAAYLAVLRAVAAGHPVRFVVNAARDRVRAELARAAVCWHAMGLGVDADREPEKIEHFGIAPVEAMAAGCVPVVLDRGGPAEVVEDGRSGLTCGSLAAMTDALVALAADPARRGRMAAAARERAAAFSVERFRREFRGIAESMLARPAEVTV